MSTGLDVLSLLDWELEQRSEGAEGASVSEELPGEALLLAGAQQAQEEGFEVLYQLLMAQLFLLRRENLTIAADYLEQALSHYQHQGQGEVDLSVFINSLLMEAYHRSSNFIRCASVARDWVARFPKCATAHAALCHVLYEQGQYDECIASCAKAIATLDESVTIMNIYNTRGKCYHKQHKYEQSVSDFSKIKALAATETLVRFTEVKEPFLTAIRAPTSPHPTPHSEKHSLRSYLISYVKAVPLAQGEYSRDRSRFLHFERGHSPGRLLTNSLGHVLDI